MSEATSAIGTLIRQWRTRRRMSQLDLAGEAEISQRHLSFIESGRSAVPSGVVCTSAATRPSPQYSTGVLV